MANKYYKFFKSCLSTIVTLGILAMLTVTVYIAWIEFQRLFHTELESRLIPDTRWTIHNFRMYFSSGKKFGTVNIDGSDRKILYTALTPVEEFIFSPDGKYIAIVTKGDILLYDCQKDQIDPIYNLGSMVKEDVAHGLVRGVQWFSDSRKFCFEVYQSSTLGPEMQHKCN